jgi:CRISPR-associated protein Csx10
VSVLQLTLKQPAQIGYRSRSDFVLPTLRHVPGAVVRGALAAAWIARHGESTPAHPRRAEFLELFEGGVRYGPLFSGEPFPSLALLSHKYDSTDRCDHDDLDEVTHPDAPSACPQCGSPWAAQTTLRSEADLVVRRRTSVVMHHSGVAARGGLFSRERLPARRSDGSELCFTGHLMARDPASLRVLADVGPIRIGGRRTTHGLATVDIDQAGMPELPERLDDGTVVLRLRAPAVFVDAHGRPSPTPEHHLGRYLGQGCRITRSWYRWETVGGWHIASGLPKPAELAVTPGSTFLVRPARTITDQDLRLLAEHGVGLRRHEGFGDLGPTASARPGRLAREADRRRRENLVARVAAVRGLATRPDTWKRVTELLTGHADGDTAATTQLNTVVSRMTDPAIRVAMERLLGYAPDDVRTVLQEWS